MGGLVLAMVVGALVPPLVVSVLGSRDPIPRNCSSGPVSGTRLDGAILHSTGADLWYSEGLPGQPRRLIDYAPPPARLTPAGTPSPGTASPSPVGAASTPSPLPSASSSPGAGPTEPRILAADISADRRLVAMLVLNPPEHPGEVSIRLLNPLDQPAKPPLEAWHGPADPHPEVAGMVRILDNGKVLVVVPIPREALGPPVPLVVPSPAPSAAAPTPTSSVAPTAAATASPSASPRPGTPAEVIVVDATAVRVVAGGPLDYFLSIAHSGWPETRSYRVPPVLPRLQDRVDGPSTRVAGLVQRQVDTPLAQRHLNEILQGTGGRPATTVVCAAAPGMVPLAFSPDEAGLALFNGTQTWYIDLSGSHAVTRLLDGKILSWRA